MRRKDVKSNKSILRAFRRVQSSLFRFGIGPTVFGSDSRRGCCESQEERGRTNAAAPEGNLAGCPPEKRWFERAYHPACQRRRAGAPQAASASPDHRSRVLNCERRPFECQPKHEATVAIINSTLSFDFYTCVRRSVFGEEVLFCALSWRSKHSL